MDETAVMQDIRLWLITFKQNPMQSSYLMGGGKSLAVRGNSGLDQKLLKCEFG